MTVFVLFTTAALVPYAVPLILIAQLALLLAVSVNLNVIGGVLSLVQALAAGLLIVTVGAVLSTPTEIVVLLLPILPARSVQFT